LPFSLPSRLNTVSPPSSTSDRNSRKVAMRVERGQIPLSPYPV